MSLELKLRNIAVLAAIAGSVYGCNTSTQTSPVQTRQDVTLTERVKEEPRPEPTKYISVTGRVLDPFSNLPTFDFANYRQSYQEDSKKYRRTFDIEPIDAKDFSLPSKDGTVLNFRELAQINNYVLIEFTGPDCFPCKKLLPHLERFYARNKYKVELISLVSGGDMEWNQYLAEHNVGYPLAFDSDCNILREYGFGSIPSMVLTQKGKVISVCSGFNKEAEKWLSTMEEAINKTN